MGGPRVGLHEKEKQQNVSDYYTPAQLALKLGLSEAEISEFELNGLLHVTVKDGRRFFSSRQAHRLGAALRLARKQKVSLERAVAKIEDLRLSLASTSGD